MTIARLKLLRIFVSTVLSVALVLTALSLVGCSPLETQAYRLVVASNAFLKSIKTQHPECQQAQSPVCTYIVQATAAKDALIDAVEIYCAGPDFNAGGKCNPPTRGTPGAQQAEAKLRAAISSYERIETLLKTAAGK